MQNLIPAVALVLLTSVTAPSARDCAADLASTPRASLADRRLTRDDDKPYAPVSFTCPARIGDPYEIIWRNQTINQMVTRTFDLGDSFVRLIIYQRIKSQPDYWIVDITDEDVASGWVPHSLQIHLLEVAPMLRDVCRGGAASRRQLDRDLAVNRFRLRAAIDLKVRGLREKVIEIGSP